MVSQDIVQILRWDGLEVFVDNGRREDCDIGCCLYFAEQPGRLQSRDKRTCWITTYESLDVFGQRLGQLEQRTDGMDYYALARVSNVLDH
jgi:hypothetical protein